MEDNEIIELYFARNEQAVAESEKRYGSFCMGISMNILRQRQDAEECVNDTWLHAWNHIPSTEAEYIACAARLLRTYMNFDVEGWAAGVSKSGVSMSDRTVSFDRLVGGLPCRSDVSVKFNSAGQVTQMLAFDSMSSYADLRLDGARARAYFDNVASYEYAPYPYETESRSVNVYLLPIGGELYIVGDTEYSWYEQDGDRQYLFKNGNEYAVKAEGFLY